MALERDPSDSSRGSTGGGAGVGTFWLRRGEWKRNLSVVGFACIVTACCIGVKIVTAYIGRGIWSDMSASDIIIATLFYQFSLYVCVRLAKRGFTLGELGVVCHAATALFMETINMTRMKIGILRTPYIKTYRLPTPLLTFQLALMPGSLLTGFLLSPLLYLSRHLAQKPAYRLRFPHEKPMHRRLLALGFYAGALLVCGGVVGLWARWCLGSRDPWLWVVLFLLDGKYTYTRPALIAYWSALAAISVAGWQRQLSRARRHRTYVVAASPTPAVSSALSDHFKLHASNQPSTVTQMMDAADHAMPVLSVNARRKFFHALAVIMFIPGIAIDPAFTHLSLSVAFAAFTFAEYVRYFALWPLGASVHLFLNEFLDHKDSGTAILSHFYLLAGCAAPLWLEGPSEILAHFGVLALGIGDALASIVGRRFGHVRWASGSGKTIEGSAAFFLSVLFSATALAVTGATERFSVSKFAATTAVSTVLEAVSMQNDNLILPMYGWAIGTLLGV
ncbi:dolichol kinase [Cryptotrichosporon argae]